MSVTCEALTHSTHNLKPYPLMKESGVGWLGRVPAYWRAAPLRRYCRVFAGATPDRSVAQYWESGSIPWLSSGDVNLRRIRAARQFITEAGFERSSTNWIRPGSLVLALAGQGRTKGMVATVEFSTTGNQSLAAIEPAKGESRYEYLAYYLESRYRDIRALVGDGLRDGLNLQHVRSIPTPLPPLLEQAAIVRFLDHADRRIRRYIRAKQKLIAVLEEKKQAIIHEAVTGQIDVRTERPYPAYKDSGAEWLGPVPAHWDVSRSKHVFRPRTELARPGDTQLSATQAYGVIAQADYEEKIGRKVTKILRHLDQRHHAEVDDFVISMRSFQGGLERVWESGCIRSSYIVLQAATARLIVGYFGYLFKSAGYIGALQSTANFIRDGQDLNFENFCQVDVPVPPSSEQQEIAQALDTEKGHVGSRIVRSRQQIDLLREYRSRLIADVVTGKLDVREAAAGLPELNSVAAGYAVDAAASARASSDLNALQVELEEAGA